MTDGETHDDVWHRAGITFIQNKPTGSYYVLERAMHRKYCPGWYDLGFYGGMLKKDYFLDDGSVNPDADRLNAYRECAEVLGIPSACVNQLRSCGVIKYKNDTGNVKLFMNLYITEMDLPADFQFENLPKDVKSIKLYSKA